MNWLTEKQREELKSLKINHYKYITFREAQDLIEEYKEMSRLETWNDMLILEKLVSIK